MDNATRLQYLQAMGITAWVPRNSPPVSGFAEPVFETEPMAELATDNITQIPEVSDNPKNDNPDKAWVELEAEVATCTLCDLCQTRTQTVFGTGNKSADWMIIGEAPGQHEDEQGKPFVGKAGQLLTEMLRSVGLGRDDVFITNILKCRPPGNRDPKPDEAERCGAHLSQQRELVNPKIILAVGRIAAQTLLNTDEPLSKLRNRVHRLGNTPVVVVYHPAYLLRSLVEKRKAWLDLLLAVRTVNEGKG